MSRYRQAGAVLDRLLAGPPRGLTGLRRL